MSPQHTGRDETGRQEVEAVPAIPCRVMPRSVLEAYVRRDQSKRKMRGIWALLRRQNFKIAMMLFVHFYSNSLRI